MTSHTPYADLSRAVRRDRETETRVRAMDAHEIVEEIHKHEDTADRLREINAELLAALQRIQSDAVDYLGGDKNDLMAFRALAETEARAAIAKAEGGE